MNRLRLFAAVALAAGLTLPPAALFAQRVESSETTPVGPTAELTRKELTAVMKQYPSSLGRIVRLDPTLMDNQEFIKAYPAFAAFIAKYPEVRRAPDYFFANYDNWSYYYRDPQIEMWQGILAGVAVFVIVITALFAIGWIIRTFIDYRRWNRVTRTQNEMHAKLLDRFGSNAELIAYVQSPAGARFLQASPMPIDTPRSIAAPFGRILWSVQAGMVMAALGLGLYYVSGEVDPQVSEPLFTLGIVALFLGIGFVVSAIAAYVLSRQLGLFNQPSQYERRDSVGA